MANQAEDIRADLMTAKQLSDYEAVEVLWTALVKAANFIPGPNERTRMCALVERMQVAQVKEVLDLPAVDTLLCLNPPLETVLAAPPEILKPECTRLAIGQVRRQRKTNSTEALLALGEILKLIRNKRAHGFKTRSGPRDREILGAARSILLRLCELAIQVVD